MDPELPFFCHTLNERFSAGLLPSFDKAPIGCNDNGGDNEDDLPLRNPYHLHRLVRNTREDSSILLQGDLSCQQETGYQPGKDFTIFDVGLPPLLQ